MRNTFLVVAAMMVFLLACSKEHDEQPIPGAASPVNYSEQEIPYETLSEYGFFNSPMKGLQPVQGVLPYDIITPLFTDHAKKSRFVWMRSGSQAEYVSSDKPFTFDNGTVLIKNFYYDNVQSSDERRIIETRLMFKRNGLWEFANYVWNNEQTEAYFDLEGSYTSIAWQNEDGALMEVDYRIPSAAECLACHKENSLPYPIGTKPQNMEMMIERSGALVDQLSIWEQAGYLASGYPSITPIADWDDPTEPLQDRVRAYLDVNCSHCHADQKYCDYRPIRLAWNETSDPINLGICVVPDDPIAPDISHIVSAGDTARSMMHYRLSATEENVRMPLLGRSVVHEEAVDLIADWINSLDPPCN